MDNKVELDTTHEIEAPEEKLLDKPKRHLNWKVFFVAIIVVVLIEVVAFRFLNTEEDVKLLQSIVPNNYTKEKSACTAGKGSWLEKYHECENGIDQSSCTTLNGKFNDCESMCRHDENNGKVMKACPMICVKVCKFN